MFFDNDQLGSYVATLNVSCGCYVFDIYMQYMPPWYSQSSDQIIVSNKYDALF